MFENSGGVLSESSDTHWALRANRCSIGGIAGGRWKDEEMSATMRIGHWRRGRAGGRAEPGWGDWVRMALAICDKRAARWQPTTHRWRVPRRWGVSSLSVAAVTVAVLMSPLAWGGVFGADPAAASGESGESTIGLVVIVKPGQSLWDVAARTMPGDHPWDAIDEIKRRNGLEGNRLSAGQVLEIPGG